MGLIPAYDVDSPNLSRQIRQHLRHQVPFVFRNWEPVVALRHKWTKEYLLQHFGKKRFNAMLYNQTLKYVPPTMRGQHGSVHRLRKTLQQAYDFVQNDGHRREMLYMAIAPFMQVVDQDMVNAIFDSSHLHTMWDQQEARAETIRIGFDELNYCLHHDHFNNMLAQVNGEKLIMMMNPLQGSHIYWEKNESHMHWTQSPIWPRDPDYKQYPLFKRAKGLQYHLKAGDIVYIPPFWWHYLEANDPTQDTDPAPYWMTFNRFMTSHEDFTGDKTWPCARACLSHMSTNKRNNAKNTQDEL